ncbi:PucR family transcriptional regulator [Streptomyces sp. NPDC055722]
MSVVALSRPGTWPHDWSAELGNVAKAMRLRISELAEQQVLIARKLSAYAHVSDEELMWSARRNVQRLVRTLSGEEGDTELSEEERSTLTNRSMQGIDAEDVIHCYRLVMTYLCDEYVDQAARLHVPAEATMAGMRKLWKDNDRFTNELVKARSQIDLGIALRQDRQRQIFLQRVLSGGLRPAEIALGGAQYGLTADGEYWAVKASPVDRPTAGLISHLERFASGNPVAALVSVADGDMVGIATRRPIPFDAVTPIAVVGPVRLSGLHRAFAEAARLLDVAKRFGKGGIIEPSSLGVLLAVANEPELGESLYDKYIGRVLRDAGSMAEVLLETVDVFLGLNRGYQATASALHVHVNTLRHRIGRFEEIVGDTFSRPEVALETWWALRYAGIRQG